jgi:plastocyanin
MGCLSRSTAIAALLFLTVEPVHAGVIRGTLRLPSRPEVTAAMDPYPGHAGAMAGMHTIARGLPADAVVFVETIPAAKAAALQAAATESYSLAQKNQAFVPRVLAIAAGTMVQFPNQDPIYHNVFSLSPARRFDLGKYPNGDSRQVVFTKPGLVKVYCDIHSNMEAFIYVLPHHAFTRPTAAGEFTLPDLPPGRYQVHAWHPDLGEVEAPADVPMSGDVMVDLSF